MEQSILSLRCGQWSAGIGPNYGANILYLRHGNRDVLQPLPNPPGNPFLVGAPLLLPANRTANARFSFGGRTYHLPASDALSGANLHGQLYSVHFNLESRSRTSAILSYRNKGTIYPFPFSIHVKYYLTDQGLHSEYLLHNPSDSVMPFTFGLHTTFAAPTVFRVPISECQEKDAQHIPTGRYIPLNRQELKYTTGSISDGLVISGFYRASGNTAVIDELYSYTVKGFDHWILYNAQGHERLLCVEPQLGGVNALNHVERCPTLPPGDSIKLVTDLYVSQTGPQSGFGNSCQA